VKESVILLEKEKKLLECFKRLPEGASANISKLEEDTEFNPATINSIIQSLLDKNLIKISRTVERVLLRITSEGQEYVSQGLPEKRLLRYLVMLEKSVSVKNVVEAGPIGFDKEKTTIGVRWLMQKGWATTKEGFLALTDIGRKSLDALDEDERLLDTIAKGGEQVYLETLPQELRNRVDILRGRKLLETVPVKDFEILLTESGKTIVKGKAKISEAMTRRLTKDHLVSGEWKNIIEKGRLKPYNILAEPPKIHGGKRHPYADFLDDVRRALIGLGFEEATGPYVELEFWNFDALFQAQDHPAREIHDSYILRYPEEGRLEGQDEYVRNVWMAHENGWTTGSTGWRYHWNINTARRLILRTQTTAVSMRHLAQHKKPPVKMFCLSKNFRPDVLDATHAQEFNQLEGIVLQEHLNLKHLIGYLKEITEALGIRKVRFKPGYFPFTEPSVECFIYHEKFGWIEAAGSGLFRPEVLEPLGIKRPINCLAWGVGIERLAMLYLDIDDIRYLHATDLEWLRERSLRL